MLVSKSDLEKTSLYRELIHKISRGSDEAVNLQILAAEELVKSYMSKYDLDAIFGFANENGDEIPPAFHSEIIKKIVKIIASYYLVRLSNPNVDIELYRADYEDALKWLEDLQAGKLNPNLPYAETSENPSGAGGDVWFESNPKRNNFFK